ncbi:MAG TPA: HTH-type transcriptional activator IlvY, partial [Actinopolymorphaceae bacterium]
MEYHGELRLFVHLTRTLNFGRTSAECHVSPATLTRAIQRLETRTGERLLDRGPRGVALTESGLAFHEYAQNALELWDSYRRGATAPERGLSGQLRIFASVTACQSLLPDLLAPFRARHPHVGLDIMTGDAPAAMARLDEGAVDLAVAALPERIPEQFQSKEIARTPLVFVASPELRRCSWAETTYVLPRRGLARDHADRWFRRRGFSPTIGSEADGHEALLTLVALGVGVGVVPELVLESGRARERLVVLPVRPALEVFRVGLCVRRADLRRPAVSALWSS